MSVADEIDKLNRLREQGVLSEEEFAKAKAAVLAGQTESTQSRTTGLSDPLRNFFRSRNDRWLGGVCGGLAELTGVPSWVWRFLFCVIGFFAGVGVIAYVLLWILVPEKPVNR